jgi:hypothetical protein
LCRNGGKNGHEEGNKTDHDNHPLMGRTLTMIYARAPRCAAFANIRRARNR